MLLVRHGRTAWSQEGRYQGRSDPPLSRDGVEEASGAAQRLPLTGAAAVFSSPLGRARSTAEIICRALHWEPPCIEPDLMEIAYGSWEGLTQLQVKSMWPEQMRHWKRSPQTFQFPSGETLEAAGARLTRFFGEVQRRLDGDPSMPVVAVTHCGLIRLATLMATGAPLERFRHIRIDPASVHRFTLAGQIVSSRDRGRTIATPAPGPIPATICTVPP